MFQLTRIHTNGIILNTEEKIFNHLEHFKIYSFISAMIFKKCILWFSSGQGSRVVIENSWEESLSIMNHVCY